MDYRSLTGLILYLSRKRKNKPQTCNNQSLPEVCNDYDFLQYLHMDIYRYLYMKFYRISPHQLKLNLYLRYNGNYSIHHLRVNFGNLRQILFHYIFQLLILLRILFLNFHLLFFCNKNEPLGNILYYLQIYLYQQQLK